MARFPTPPVLRGQVSCDLASRDLTSRGQVFRGQVSSGQSYYTRVGAWRQARSASASVTPANAAPRPAATLAATFTAARRRAPVSVSRSVS